MAPEPSKAEEQDVVADSNASAPEQMRRAREAAGLTLEEVAARTRVPMRHLAALEAGDYNALPGTTYCAGFSRAFARAVGLDEAALVAKVRAEIDEMGGLGQDPYEIEEPVDPSSVPPRYLAWVAAVLVLLFAGGYAIWRMQLNTPPTDEQLAAEERTETRIADPVAPPRAAVGVAPRGPVVLTAVNEVWLRVYEPDGQRLFEGMLAKDERYTVPDNARNPMILTGRPDALAVTVSGRAVPPLGTAERTISDVPISAAALLSRQAGQDNEDAAPAPPAPGSPLNAGAGPAPRAGGH
ncbi:putative Xre family transcriptional regulator [Sphingobium sp. SYK-6]|uniref:helix-turn-helix domain-containing protein n=1 Tax=Sphingobium sp. (strain NBRC 103272 / SYK-6) TaxID=627192 RepID=UPI000227734F|nr:helix-turn-helix domain-containing protein [Sphingobium sp. SYK-6]BAK67032.1 putative Xre family transcriptional regulator [Sphingobium sp. SYK-6]